MIIIGCWMNNPMKKNGVDLGKENRKKQLRQCYYD